MDTLTLYSLSTLISLKMKKRRMKRFPTRSLAYLGILAVEAANKDQEDCPENGSHLQRLAWDVTVTLHGYRASVHTSTGEAPPPSLSIQLGDRASRGGRSPVNRSSAKVQAWLNLKCMTTLYNYIKRGWNKLPTRRFIPVKFKKETLCPKRYYLFNQTSGASERLTMKAHVQWLLWLRMVTNSRVLWMPVQLRNTLSKNNSSISRKPEKAA